ncbi:MAG: DUF4349 domain-containing protein [Treponema sp.]|jgi:hypothetical protein|nr:DUF4349 domain-containing protein [Treponema sp.]
MKLSGRGIGCLAILFLPLAGIGCSAGSSSASVYSREPVFAALQQESGAAAGGGYAYDSVAESVFPAAFNPAGETLPGEEAPPLADPERKLIRRAELRLRVPDPEAAEEPLLAAMEKYGAYASSVGIYENSRNYTIRTPRDSYRDLLEELNAMGRVLYRTENAEDVTLRYYDLEGRLNTSRELLKTFQSYLGQAKNIDEIMTVEQRIAELQGEIDRTGTQFRSLANLVDYATIELELAGPASVSPAAPTLGERIGGLFRSFGETASLALVVLTALVVYGVPALLLFALLFLILFGRIGLVKKLWGLASGKKEKKVFPEPESGTGKNGAL